MDHDAKAKFILALHKHSLQAFDSGGTVLSGPTGGTTQGDPGAHGFAGSIGNILGLNNNFQAGAVPIQQGTNAAQLNQAYSGVQGGLQGQQNFANQAAAQGGFGNQSNVFAQQQALANQLQQQAMGQGPNPAQAALNQATGQNVANQGALMASQRGAGANVGLLARQAAQQGANTQQQAVGQGATLQAQQQIAAQAALANQQAQMQGVAANQIAAQGQGANAVSNAQQNEQNILQNANTSGNNTAVAQQGNVNNVNSQVASNNQVVGGKIIGGIANGVSSLVRGLFASGGVVKGYAGGGGVTGPALSSPGGPGPQSFAGQWLNSNSSPSPAPQIAAPVQSQIGPDFFGDKKDQKESKDSPNPIAATDTSIAPKMDVSDSGMAAGAALAAGGGKVKANGPNQKATKKDNSFSNDKVPAMLSEGEIVLPRSVTTHPQAPQKAAEFVRAALAKKMAGRK